MIETPLSIIEYVPPCMMMTRWARSNDGSSEEGFHFPLLPILMKTPLLWTSAVIEAEDPIEETML